MIAMAGQQGELRAVAASQMRAVLSTDAVTILFPVERVCGPDNAPAMPRTARRAARRWRPPRCVRSCPPRP